MDKLELTGKWPELVDYTGGTKSMSAAVVWASSCFACKFSYVGTDEPGTRTKGGLGIVVGGKEKCLLRENPWNAIAYYSVQYAVALFNSGQFSNAVISLNSILERVSDPKRKRVITLVNNVWQGFEAWDRFDHTTAIKLLKKNVPSLLDIVDREETLWLGITCFAEQSLECSKLLESIVTKKPYELSRKKIHDLLSNSVRRARLEHKYDDATARCYATIEKFGKYTLMQYHSIDNSKCRQEQLPDSLRAEFTKRYANIDSEFLKFGLQATYLLLVTLKDPVGERYLENKAELDKLLSLRNASILGHGCIPIKPDNYEKLLAVALRLMDSDESKLTRFPIFK